MVAEAAQALWIAKQEVDVSVKLCNEVGARS